MDYIDSDVESVNEWESRQSATPVAAEPSAKGKVPIGKVSQFFDRLNVAAINLTGSLKVGDIIEIGTDDEAIRQRVASIQIDRKGVEEASEGDDIGIKLKWPVSIGSDVYKIE